MFVCMSAQSVSMSSSLPPSVLQPARLLCPWDFSGKNTGVRCHFSFPGNLPDPGIEPLSPTLQADSLPAECRFAYSGYFHINGIKN